MSQRFEKGDPVTLLSIPEWLLRDLPADEQREMRSFVGRRTVIEDVDVHGYLWVGFGTTQDSEGSSHYGGHSFCVPPDCLEVVKADRDG